jgi:hypothetical protein
MSGEERVIRITDVEPLGDLHKIIGRATNRTRILTRLNLPEHGVYA